MQPTTNATTQTSPNLASSAGTSSEKAVWKGRTVEWKKTDEEPRIPDTKTLLEMSRLQQLIRECEERCPSLEREKKRLEKEIDKLKKQINRLSPNQQQMLALEGRQKAKEELTREIPQTTDPEKLEKLKARLTRTEASLKAPQELPQRNNEALALIEQELLEKESEYRRISHQLTFEQGTISDLTAQLAAL